jgi:hypothetical protein
VLLFHLRIHLTLLESLSQPPRLDSRHHHVINLKQRNPETNVQEGRGIKRTSPPRQPLTELAQSTSPEYSKDGRI